MDNRQKILTASLKLFIQEGFHGASTAKIANEAGISNGALFYHFKTKEELINQLYLFLKDGYKETLLKNIQDLPIHKNTIKKLWYACANWYIEHPNEVTFFQMYNNSPYIDSVSKEEAENKFVFLIDLISLAIKEEILTPTHPEILTNFFFASIQAIFRFIKSNPEINKEEYMDIAFKMWWRSVVNI